MSRPELIKDVVNSIAEYVPGKSIEEIAKKYGIDPIDIIKLGSNENVLGPSQKAVEALISYASKVNIYPSADASELVEASFSLHRSSRREHMCFRSGHGWFA